MENFDHERGLVIVRKYEQLETDFVHIFSSVLTCQVQISRDFVIEPWTRSRNSLFAPTLQSLVLHLIWEASWTWTWNRATFSRSACLSRRWHNLMVSSTLMTCWISWGSILSSEGILFSASPGAGASPSLSGEERFLHLLILLQNLGLNLNVYPKRSVPLWGFNFSQLSISEISVLRWTN